MDKRYWLFAWQYKYEQGGIKDFKGSFETMERCVVEFVKLEQEGLAEFYHVFDSQEKEIVMEGDWSDFKE